MGFRKVLITVDSERSRRVRPMCVLSLHGPSMLTSRLSMWPTPP